MSILVNKDDNPCASWLTILFTLIKLYVHIEDVAIVACSYVMCIREVMSIVLNEDDNPLLVDNFLNIS